MILSSVGYTPDEFPSSQGLKATLLAWACRYGIPEESRAALGYHVGRQKLGIVQVYARNRMEVPRAELSNMLIDIEKNIFDPYSGDILSWQIEAKRKARKSSDPASKASDSE